MSGGSVGFLGRSARAWSSRSGLAAVAVGACVLALLVGAAPMDRVVVGARVVAAFAAVVLLAPHVALAVLAALLATHNLLLQATGEVGRLTPLGVADDALIVTAIAALLVRTAFVGERPEVLRSRAFLMGLGGLATFALAGIASAVAHDVPVRVAAEGAFLALKGPLLLVAVVTVPLEPRARDRLLLAGLGLWGAIWASAALQVLMPDLAREVPGLLVQERLGQRSAAGLLGHPGLLGWAMAVGALAAGGFALRRRSVPLWCASAMFAGGAVLSLRAKPLVGLLAAAVVAAAIVPRRTQATRSSGYALGALVALAALAVVLFTPVGALPRRVLETQAESYVAAGDATARGAMYRASGDVAADRFPLGAGFGRFGSRTAFREYSPLYYAYGFDEIWGLSPGSGQFANDFQWPATVGESGALGTLGFVVFLGSVGLLLAKRARSSAMALVALLVLVESAVESIALPVYSASLTAFVVFVLAGLALREEPDRAEARPGAAASLRRDSRARSRAVARGLVG